jgi:hypothetical protein
MQTLPLHRYRQLRHWLPFDQLADKFYGVLVLASMTPLLVMIGFLLFAPQHWQPERLLGWTTVATLFALALSIWLTHALLAPVTLARLALHAYQREQRLLPMPLDLDGEAGGLINDLHATIEACERQRQIFAEQADRAFREQPRSLPGERDIARRAPGPVARHASPVN